MKTLPVSCWVRQTNGQMSEHLAHWHTVQTNTSPDIWYWGFSLGDPPQAFFRARQER